MAVHFKCCVSVGSLTGYDVAFGNIWPRRHASLATDPRLDTIRHTSTHGDSTSGAARAYGAKTAAALGSTDGKLAAELGGPLLPYDACSQHLGTVRTTERARSPAPTPTSAAGFSLTFAQSST